MFSNNQYWDVQFPSSRSHVGQGLPEVLYVLVWVCPVEDQPILSGLLVLNTCLCSYPSCLQIRARDILRLCRHATVALCARLCWTTL